VGKNPTGGRGDQPSSNFQGFLELQQVRVHDAESVITTNSPPVSDVETQGLYCRRKAPPASLVSRITITCKHYSSSLCNCPFWPAYNLRIDGIPALIAPSTRRIVKEYSPLMSVSAERAVEKVIRYEAVFHRGPFSAWRLAKR